MNQQRVFVSYVPVSQAKRRGATLTARRATQPVAAMVAGALIVGGAVHFGDASQGDEKALKPATAHFDAVPNPIGKAVRAPLPYLAVVSVAASPEPDAIAKPAPTRPIASVAPRPEQRPKTAMVAPRRDLAGFLEERGLSLAAPEPASGTGDWASGDSPEAPVALVEVADFVTPSGISLASIPEMDVVSSVPPPLPPSPAIETQTFPMVLVGGEPLGAVTMRGDKVHLASLVGLLKLKLPAAEFARLKASPAADTFVGLDTLRAAGIAATLDPGGERITLAAE